MPILSIQQIGNPDLDFSCKLPIIFPMPRFPGMRESFAQDLDLVRALKAMGADMWDLSSSAEKEECDHIMCECL